MASNMNSTYASPLTGKVSKFSVHEQGKIEKKKATFQYQAEEDQLLCHLQSMLSMDFLSYEDPGQCCHWAHGLPGSDPMEESKGPQLKWHLMKNRT